MNWIFAAIIFALLVWNVYLTDDRDYWRDLAESKDTDNERENDKLIRMVNAPKRRTRDADCPCFNPDDGYYSWIPEDDFFCAYGERRGADMGDAR